MGSNPNHHLLMMTVWISTTTLEKVMVFLWNQTYIYNVTQQFYFCVLTQEKWKQYPQKDTYKNVHTNFIQARLILNHSKCLSIVKLIAKFWSILCNGIWQFKKKTSSIYNNVVKSQALYWVKEVRHKIVSTVFAKIIKSYL